MTEARDKHMTLHDEVLDQQVARACGKVSEALRHLGLAKHATGYFTICGNQIVAGIGAPGCETPVVTINITALLRTGDG